MGFILSGLKNNKTAFVFAFLIGVVCIAPHIIFRISLGDEYKGIYLMQTANELEYLGRIQEVADGHWALSSVPFFEYKDGSSLMPASFLEVLIAIGSKIFSVSIASLVILSKFFLPVILFLLVYFFIRQLALGKLNAIAAGALIVLGYDLIDYRSLFGYLAGVVSPNVFLLWTRPINPIFGGLLIFSFLLIVWRLYNKNQVKLGLFVLGGIIFVLAMSYFFTWGIILSLIGVLFIIGLFQERFRFVKGLIFISLLGFLLSVPYFYNVLAAAKDVSYKESVLRTGMFLTHQPIFNKLLILSLLMFLVSAFFKRELIKKNWWIFSLSLILGSFLAYNQQIITGRTVWPWHFVQYTIPLAISAVFILLGNFKFSAEGGSASGGKNIFSVFIIIISFSFGIYVQASTYKQSFEDYKDKQKYGQLFDWLDENNKKDCVILSQDRIFLNRAIPAFTKCDVYVSNFSFFVIPSERLLHNYFVYLRLENISDEEIENYVNQNYDDILISLYAAQTMIGPIDLGKYQDILEDFKKDYKLFYNKDFREELEKYRVDYLITESESVHGIDDLTLVYSKNNLFIYEF